MKKLLAALLAGTAVFAVVYGAAATLIVDGGTIQAGGDTDLSCDENGIEVVAWATNTDPVLEGVEWVTIKGVDDDCDGARILGRVTLTGSTAADNASFAYTSGTPSFGGGYSEVIANGNANTEYKLYLKKSDLTTDWFVPAADIVGIKDWLEGDSADAD